MSGEVVRRRRKKGGKRRREEEEEREEKEEQREEGEEEPILVTDAAAKEDLAGGTHSTLVKSLFLAGILGRQIFHIFATCHNLPYIVILGVTLFKNFLMVSVLRDWAGWRGEGFGSAGQQPLPHA